MGMAPMPLPRATAGLTGVAGWARPSRTAPPDTCPRGGVKRLGQPLNLAPQTIAFAFEPRVLVAQSITCIARLLNLAAQPLQLPLSVADRLRASRRGTRQLWQLPKKYKPKSWITPGDPLTSCRDGNRLRDLESGPGRHAYASHISPDES